MTFKNGVSTWGTASLPLLIAADLQARELLEHFLEGKLHLRLISRDDRAQENFRHLLVNCGQRNSRFPARHSSFDLGCLQENPAGSVDAFNRLDIVGGNLRHNVCEFERDNALNHRLKRERDRRRQIAWAGGRRSGGAECNRA